MTLESRVSLRFQQELCANANRCLVKHIEARSMAAFHSNIKGSIAFHLYNAAIRCLYVTNLDTNSQLSDSQSEFPGPLRRYIISNSSQDGSDIRQCACDVLVLVIVAILQRTASTRYCACDVCGTNLVSRADSNILSHRSFQNLEKIGSLLCKGQNHCTKIWSAHSIPWHILAEVFKIVGKSGTYFKNAVKGTEVRRPWRPSNWISQASLGNRVAVIRANSIDHLHAEMTDPKWCTKTCSQLRSSEALASAKP